MNNHSTLLIKAFNKVVKSKEQYHIFDTCELAQEINKHMSYYKITTGSVGQVIKLQKYFRTYRSVGNGNVMSYIFIPRFNSKEREVI